MLRDEEQAREFLDRHQDQLLYGSDCPDVVGRTQACKGSVILATVRKLAKNGKVERKVLYRNAKKIFKL